MSCLPQIKGKVRIGYILKSAEVRTLVSSNPCILVYTCTHPSTDTHTSIHPCTTALTHTHTTEHTHAHAHPTYTHFFSLSVFGFISNRPNIKKATKKKKEGTRVR